jgi:uncharacterized membrane protein
MDQLRPYRFVLALAALLCVALPTVALGATRQPQSAASPAAAASNTATFTDSTGEDPQGPDITTIVVSNDDAGTITFRVNVPNRPQFDVNTMLMLMFVDTDSNQATGDPQSFGADYAIQILGGEALLFKWDGTTFSLAATQSSLAYSWSGGATVKINASDLGNARKINFDALVLTGLVIDPTTGAIDDTNAHADGAPTVGLYPYDVKVGKPTLIVKKFTHKPASPKAGSSFSLLLTSARSDTKAVLQGGQVTCVGRAGSTKLVATVHRVSGGAAVCTFKIPKNAKGKTFRGTDTIVFEGLKASRSFSGKIH